MLPSSSGGGASPPAASATVPGGDKAADPAKADTVADPEASAKAEAAAAQKIESENQKSAAARIPKEGDAGKFSVKLKTVGDKLSAVQTMATLKRLGYGVYAVRSEIKGGGIVTRSIYDLRVGVFDDYVSANQFSYKLRLIGHRTANVTVIPNNLKIVTNLDD